MRVIWKVAVACIMTFMVGTTAMAADCTIAQRGCCSHHGGVAGCNAQGRTICNDDTLSPSCRCDQG